MHWLIPTRQNVEISILTFTSLKVMFLINIFLDMVDSSVFPSIKEVLDKIHCVLETIIVRFDMSRLSSILSNFFSMLERDVSL